MSTRKQIKLVHEGQYAAQIEVELIDSAEGWGPYLSLDDVHKLDDVRLALRNGDISEAAKLARVFRLTPITAA